MRTGLAMVAVLTNVLVLAGTAHAQTQAGVVGFRFEVAGRQAESVRQVDVSASLPTEEGYDPITISLTSSLDAPDPVLEAWFAEGGESEREVTLRLLSAGGPSGAYRFSGCTLSSRSLSVPGYAFGESPAESWGLACSGMERR